MVKKILISLYSLILSGMIYAQDIQCFPFDSTWFDLEGETANKIMLTTYRDIEYLLFGEYYFYLGMLETRHEFANNIDAYASSAIIQIDSYTGYRYFIKSINKSQLKPSKVFVILGSDITILADNYYGADGKFHFGGCVNDFTSRASMEEGLRYRRGTLYDRPLDYSYLDSGIATISASSYLTETLGGKLVDYKPEYMMNRICKAAEGWEFYPEFDNFMRCWAEGVPGDGIGEWLKVNFTRQSDEMMILNGYIDFGNMKAYKRNGRLKRIRVESSDPAFSMEYSFEDFVAYHTIKLPAATKSVKITILDVFKGERYSDTCVTAIALPQERWRSREDERAEVMAYLEKLGVLAYIAKIKKEQE